MSEDAKVPERATARSLHFKYGGKPTKALAKPWIGKPALQDGHVIRVGDRRVLLTGDSYVAAIHPVRDDTPVCRIHRDALKRIQKREAHSLDEDGTVRFSGQDGAVQEFKASSTQEFADGLLAKIGFNPGKGDQVVSIALDQDKLIQVAEAVGALKSGRQGVRLDIVIKGGVTSQAVRVAALSENPDDPERPYGLLMPIRCVKPHPLAVSKPVPKKPKAKP